MMTLFEMTTAEGWLVVTYSGVDSKGIGKQPVENNNPGWVFYFIFYILVGNFFIVNLFVGIVIENFNKIKDKLGGYALLTES